MIEIELPCCDDVTRLPDLGDQIECDACGVVMDLAPDRAPVSAQTLRGQTAAAPAIAA